MADRPNFRASARVRIICSESDYRVSWSIVRALEQTLGFHLLGLFARNPDLGVELFCTDAMSSKFAQIPGICSGIRDDSMTMIGELTVISKNLKITRNAPRHAPPPGLAACLLPRRSI